MKASQTAFQVLKSDTSSYTAIFSQKNCGTPFLDLHYRQKEEPDFDCEFLHIVADEPSDAKTVSGRDVINLF